MDLTEMGFIGNQNRCLEEVSPSSIMEKISFAIMSLYSMATEKYFIEFQLKLKHEKPNGQLNKGSDTRVPDRWV